MKTSILILALVAPVLTACDSVDNSITPQLYEASKALCDNNNGLRVIFINDAKLTPSVKVICWNGATFDRIKESVK